MNDEETAALIVGGHTFGKTHGNGDGDKVGAEPEAAPIEQQGLGWVSSVGTGIGPDAMGSGLEVIWTHTPTKWDNSFLEILYSNEWELFHSPAGAQQWRPKDNGWANSVPEPFGPGKTHPSMLTSDLALRFDPIYEKITRRWLDHPDELADAFARAWFKLIHRDMGPVDLYRGPLVPSEHLLWQDPIPAETASTITDADVATLKGQLAESGLTVAQLVSTAWAASSSFRGSDKRGGANGGRIRLQPQAGWEVNEPDALAQVIAKLEEIQAAFNAAGGNTVSFADLVVLGGNVGVEKAAKAAGHDVAVPFTPGRGDATQELTDVESFSYLEPRADGFRNYQGKSSQVPAEYELLDKANLLTLSAPELTVLVGGLRVLGANYEDSTLGVLTDRPETLTNDYFVNLLDMGTKWEPSYRPRLGRSQVDRQPRRPDLRFQLAAAGPGRGLRAGRRRGQVRRRLRRRLDQGLQPGPLRRLSPTPRNPVRRRCPLTGFRRVRTLRRTATPPRPQRRRWHSAPSATRSVR